MTLRIFENLQQEIAYSLSISCLIIIRSRLRKKHFFPRKNFHNLKIKSFSSNRILQMLQSQIFCGSKLLQNCQNIAKSQNFASVKYSYFKLTEPHHHQYCQVRCSLQCHPHIRHSILHVTCCNNWFYQPTIFI